MGYLAVSPEPLGVGMGSEGTGSEGSQVLEGPPLPPPRPPPVLLPHRPRQPHLWCFLLQARLQVAPTVVAQGPHHHLTAAPGPWGHKEQPQAHLLPGMGVVV